MTKDDEGGEAEDGRCAWCGRPRPDDAATGRPRRYCKRSCRQRAYESRRRGDELHVLEDEIVVSRRRLAALQDRIWQLRAVADDIERERRGRSADHERIVGDLLDAIAAVGEPD